MRKLSKLKTPRMTSWLLFTVFLGMIIYQVAPQQLPLSIYKLSLITMAGVAGFWIDRSAFPYAGPSDFMQTAYSLGAPYVPNRTVSERLQIVFVGCMIRRAIIMGCAMLGASLGA